MKIRGRWLVNSETAVLVEEMPKLQDVKVSMEMEIEKGVEDDEEGEGNMADLFGNDPDQDMDKEME